ncbi:ribosome assembly RNA-binding protein YhbY [Desulfosporosinus sp. PR]|uniref:ribosome assembly RNA-binding protein YhbY n=1 Tax=Candidatus Desulfosporosinus nitrosoreducens TaxID=3401928 RepID=UPI0027E7A120|nr:ribosome assembly RNA-binding protein YhbY [Desulfosporosinus sp. PR]MDQ7096325.1 ribosome assembly RNA-binding protein YhbY [Desulfosporosinus sp. PR]
MLTGKQKRYLRAMGNEMVPILQVGKGGIAEAVVTQADEALEARELIKGRVLQNCLEEPQSVAADLAEQTRSELVQVIGRNFLLYRPSKDKPLIVLPN